MSKIIYSSKNKATHRQHVFVMDWFWEKVRQILKIFGSGMLAFGIVVFMFSYGEIISQEVGYRLKARTYQTITQIEQVTEAKNSEDVETEAAKFNLTAYFSLVIPKIDASANIIPNVDTASGKEYLSALQKGIAHARGTGFPGQNERIFLFSHSTDSPTNFARYNAVFYLLSKLEEGDKIIVFFTAKKYVYIVTEKHVVDPSDTSWIEPKIGEEELVLMTCDPPGTAWNRLLIIARPINY